MDTNNVKPEKPLSCDIKIVDDHVECSCADAQSADAMQKMLEQGVLVRVKATVAS